MRRTLLILAIVASAGTASAETKPSSFAEDPRIRHFSYDRHEVYRLDTYMRFITSIEFAEGENIESVQVGDSESWQIVRLDRGDILSVKPLIDGAYTNMTVYTDRRPYTFELRAQKAQAGSPNLNYRVSFRYPDEEAEARRAASARASRPRDYAYYAAGEATSLRPLQVFDDGQRTSFSFPEGTRRPAIFAVDASGREAIVNVQHTGTASVVDRVSERWTVRIGNEEICVAHADVIRSVPGGRKAAQLGHGSPSVMSSAGVLQ